MVHFDNSFFFFQFQSGRRGWGTSYMVTYTSLKKNNITQTVKEIIRKRKIILKRENLTLVNADEVKEKELKRKKKTKIMIFVFLKKREFDISKC